jgi:hypothetical protein
MAAKATLVNIYSSARIRIDCIRKISEFFFCFKAQTYALPVKLRIRIKLVIYCVYSNIHIIISVLY